jgi:hypothetical protein
MSLLRALTLAEERCGFSFSGEGGFGGIDRASSARRVAGIEDCELDKAMRACSQCELREGAPCAAVDVAKDAGAAKAMHCKTLKAISRVVLSGAKSVSSYPGPTATTRDINPALSLPWYMYVDEAGTRTEISQCTSKIVSIPGLMPDDLKVFAGSGRAGVTVSEMRMAQRQRQAVALSTSSNTARKRFDVRDR